MVMPICPSLCDLVLPFVRGVLPLGAEYPCPPMESAANVMVVMLVLARAPCNLVDLLLSQRPRYSLVAD